MLKRPVTVGLYLDTRRILHDHTYPVKLRVNQSRRVKYFNTGISCTPADYKIIVKINARINYDQGKVRQRLFDIVSDAQDTINSLAVFSFTAFHKAFVDRATTQDLTIKKGFQNYITFLESEGRIGSADTYKDTLSKVRTKGRYFEDITREYLKGWEKQLYNNGLSSGSVGLHMRNLRRIYNVEKVKRPILKDLYPFTGYKIPENENPKLALSASELKQIFDYEPVNDS